MSLRGAPIMYVFYETGSLPRQRELCEQILDLQVIENQFHPPHDYHGLVKYDGGQIILSLNLSKGERFNKHSSDGLITVISVESEEAVWDKLIEYGYTPSQQSGSIFTDDFGHHYIFRSASLDAAGASHQGFPATRELRLTVSDFTSSMAFYGDILGLELLDRDDDQARFATGTVDLVIQHGGDAPDGRPVRYDTYLLVFYADNIIEMRDALVQRGLVFKNRRVGTSDIGSSTRFVDPSGHIYCLYEPSEESLTWGSGSKVKEIAAIGAARNITHLNSV